MAPYNLPPSLSLVGKTAIVTGGTRGIGLEIALELARRGANIAVVYVDAARAASVESAVSSLRSANPSIKAISVRADVAAIEASAHIVAETLKGLATTTIDILVHNAAVLSLQPAAQITPSEFERLTNTNVRGPLLLTQAALPHIPRGGRIIFISSVSARLPEAGVDNSLYGSNKAAIEAFARSWSFEFGHSRGITVNCMASPLPLCNYIGASSVANMLVSRCPRSYRDRTRKGITWADGHVCREGQG